VANKFKFYDYWDHRSDMLGEEISGKVFAGLKLCGCERRRDFQGTAKRIIIEREEVERRCT
jgi:hypothetical protein